MEGKWGGHIISDVEDGGRNIRCFRSSILSSSGVIRRRRFRRHVVVRACKEVGKEDRFTRTTTNERRKFVCQGKGRGITKPNICDLRIAREEVKKIIRKEKKKRSGGEMKQPRERVEICKTIRRRALRDSKALCERAQKGAKGRFSSLLSSIDFDS